MSSKKYQRIMRVIEEISGVELEIPESEISMLGTFEEGCWRLQLKSGISYRVCGDVKEYDKGVRYLVNTKGDNYDRVREKNKKANVT
jgi:hypothetical protein